MNAPVLLVTELFPPAVGGSAVLYQNTYSRLTDVRVWVAADPESSPGPEGPCGPFLRRHLALRTVHWGVSSMTGLRHHWRTAERLRRLVTETGGRIHCGRALPEGVAARIARARGAPPFACWAHGEDLATARMSRELALVTCNVLRAAGVVLANSRNTADTLKELGVPAEKIRVAYPGVDAERFRPDVDGSAVRRRYAAEGQILLLTVGRLQRRKGHDLVLRALAALRDHGPGLRWVIAGCGEEETRLRALARELGVVDRVHFAGGVPEAELPAYYAACDIFLMPNRRDGADIEGFGIVFLEAQASARAVIAGRTGGAPEAVTEGETALLVGGDDPAELAAALSKLAASADLRRRLGEAGRARVVREFTWDRTAQVVAEAHRALGSST